MDILLEEIRRNAECPPEHLVSAVVAAANRNGASFTNFKSDSTAVINVLSSSTLLGQHCVLHKEHFVNLIVNWVQGISESGYVEEVESVLRNVPWIAKTFGQLITLLCWENVAGESPARALPVLLSLLDYTSISSTPVLKAISDACSVLKSQLLVIDQLQKQACIQNEEPSSFQSDPEFRDLFNRAFCDLQETSVLPGVLQFSRLEYVSIEAIRALPAINLPSAESELPVRKTVRFQEANYGEPVPSLSRSNSIAVKEDNVRNRDVAVYTGYRILVALMSVIFRDAVIRKMSSSSKRGSRLSLHRETSAIDEISGSEIPDAEKLLRDVFPLEFRVEILENIFSLLFVRSNDLEEGHLPMDIGAGLDATDTDTNSLKSWSSAAKQIRDGFSCCSDKLVQKILQMLKDVVITTLGAHTKEEEENEGTGQKLPFLTSVSRDDIRTRLKKLQERLTDASWRFDIVTYPKDIPMSLNRAYAEDLARPSFLTRKFESKRSSRRRRRKRRASTILKKHMDTSVIEKMLSSPASLLRICLHRGTFNLADQVNKIFELEDHNWLQEITFGKAFQDSVERVIQRDKAEVHGKRLGSFEILADLPISPYEGLNDDQLSLLVATDLAILRITKEGAAAVKPLTDAMEKVGPARFPTAKSMNLPDMRTFEDFIKTSLELAVSLNQKPPFFTALPFHSGSAQSVAAILDEIGGRMKKLQTLLNEPTRPGSAGSILAKQLLKIVRSSLPASGLLALLSDQQGVVQTSRVNYFLAFMTFLKNYAMCMRVDPDQDHFDLIHQSCYGHLKEMFRTKRPTHEIDAFIKNMSLDVAQMLLHATWTKPEQQHPFFSLYHSSGGIIILNDIIDSLEYSPTSSIDFTEMVSSALVRVLKKFSKFRDNIYSPRTIPWTEMVSELRNLVVLKHMTCQPNALSEPSQLAFFVNLYNLLFMHSLMHAKFCSDHFDGEKSPLDNDVSRRLHFWRYRYDVAPFGQISLQDLFDVLSPFRPDGDGNRFGISRKKTNGFLMANSEHLIDVQALYGDLFEPQTSLAISDYLNRSTWYNGKKKVLHLPTWLFRVYPSDELVELIQTYWSQAGEVVFDEVTLEPSGRHVREAGKRRETSLTDKNTIIQGPKRAVSYEAEYQRENFSRSQLHLEEADLPLEDLLPYLASPCSHLADLLSSTGVTHNLLPSTPSSRSLLKLLFQSHDGSISIPDLCEIISAKISTGGDPLAVLESPLVRFALAKSDQGQLLRDMTLTMCVEKKLVPAAWLAAMRIRDKYLRMRAVSMVWRTWSLNACVDFCDWVVAEDERPMVQAMHVRVQNLKTLIRMLHSDTTGWTEVFQQWNLDTVLHQMSVQEIEKKLESQFRAFSAVMLRLDQIEPLNAWLRHSELPSLSAYQDDLQLRGLVHMLDSRPPMILSAYQLLIPMLEKCSSTRILDLLESITTPEGRIPVIRIALMTGRFDEVCTAKLKEKEVENLILRVLSDHVRKSTAHLQGHPMLLLEQLIVWNKVSYFQDILKVPGLFNFLSRRLFEDMLVEYAKKAVEVLVPGSASQSSDGKNGGGRLSLAEVLVKKFYMPVAAPSRKEWTIDSTVTNCAVCGEKFGIVSSLFESVGLASFNRKHHCRRCGRVVCVDCSAQTIQVDIYGETPVRACDECFEQTLALGSSLSRSSRASGITFGTPRIKSPLGSTPLRQPTFLRTRFLDRPASANSDQQWLFTTDNAINQRLRQDFAYAEAPDAALCIGLLKLHSSCLVAGRELLKMGNELSEWVGSHSDCGLEHVTLVNIMKTLFFNAKLLLHEDKDNVDWIHVCDTYLNQLQLVELLLDAGAAEIPSVQQLAEIDTIRRVRDQLVQQERYGLAVELSTKAGIDPAHVWLSWGRCLLRVGKFTEAQEKLSKCLKVPLDKNQASPPSATAVEDIMEVIQDARMPRRRGTFGADSVVNIVTQGNVLQADVVDASVAEHENFRKMTECLKYQEIYGTHATLLRFYVRRGLTQKALEYCLRENVNVETFVDTLVIPSLRSGRLAAFEDELLMSDPTLTKWGDYLMGICKQLTKRNMNHVLLSFQLFIKDYIRAATTCVMFFQTSSTNSSYQEYFDKLYYLEEAQKHLTTYLDQQTTLTAEPLHRIRLTMSPEETRKYIKTIKLQSSITQLLASKAQPIERRPTPSTSLPTLFGNSQAKTDLIVMLLELHNTPKVDDCVLTVMENHGLNAEEVLIKVAPLASRDGLKGILGVLLTLKKQKTLSDVAYDGLVVRMLGQCSATAVLATSKEWEVFIKQMSSDEKKVDAFVKAKKLRSAYLLAVQMQRPDLVSYVGVEAQSAGDSAVGNLCTRWLETKNRK